MRRSTVKSTSGALSARQSISKAQVPNFGEVQVQRDPILARSFRGHEGALTSVDFDPKMYSVASSSKDSVVCVWNFIPNQRPLRFVGHKGPVYCVKYSPDGQTIASCGQDRSIRLWQNSMQSNCEIIKAHSASVRSLSFSNDGTHLLSSSDDKTLKLLRLSDNKFVFTLNGHKSEVRSGIISPDMRLIASGSDDKTVKIWDFNSQNVINTYSDHFDTVSQVLFNPDGTCVFSSSFDQKIKVTDIRSKKLVQHYNAHDAAVNSISIHPTGYFLASVGSDAKIKIWDLRAGKQMYTLYSNDKDVTTVNFNQSGDYFSTGGSQTLCMVWKTNFDLNVKNLEQICTRKTNIGEHCPGGFYQSAHFKTNKTSSRSPTRSHRISLIPPEQLHDALYRNDDELNNARIEHKQSSSPTFSQQQQQQQQQGDFPIHSGLDIVTNQFNLQQIHQTHTGKSQNDSVASHKNAPPFQAADFQTSTPNPPSQFQQSKIGVSKTASKYPQNYIPKVEDDNIMTEGIAESMKQIYSKIDTIFRYMNNLDNRVFRQEQVTSTFSEQNLKTEGQSNGQTYNPKQQTVNFGYTNKYNDQSLSSSINDRNVANIFQTGALANTGQIEASMVNKQQDE